MVSDLVLENETFWQTMHKQILIVNFNMYKN